MARYVYRDPPAAGRTGAWNSRLGALQSYYEMMPGTNPTFSATMPANRPAKRRDKRSGSHPIIALPKVRYVAIVAVPPARMLDVVGPAEVFADANKLHGGDPVYEVEIIAAAEDRAVPTQIGVPILAHWTYRELHGPIDTLLVAGGEWPPDKRHSPDFLSWLRDQSRNVRRLGSVCTGALVLADADLLNGRPATTHWNWCNELIQKHPLVKVDPDPIYVRDKNVYTSAGVTAGIDLALALVEEDLGSSLALQVARMMVVFLRRSGGQSQFSATLAAQACERQPLRDLLAWMADNVTRDLSVTSLSRRASMSLRNFARVFKQQVGETPAQHIENLRLEAARRKLETSSLSLEQVAEASGFRSAEILRRTFARRLGTTPGQYRACFGQAKIQ
jgi:transcriptional regulator GlxA family with amidase domain